MTLLGRLENEPSFCTVKISMYIGYLKWIYKILSDNRRKDLRHAILISWSNIFQYIGSNELIWTGKLQNTTLSMRTEANGVTDTPEN